MHISWHSQSFKRSLGLHAFHLIIIGFNLIGIEYAMIDGTVVDATFEIAHRDILKCEFFLFYWDILVVQSVDKRADGRPVVSDDIAEESQLAICRPIATGTSRLCLPYVATTQNVRTDISFVAYSDNRFSVSAYCNFQVAAADKRSIICITADGWSYGDSKGR